MTLETTLMYSLEIPYSIYFSMDIDIEIARVVWRIFVSHVHGSGIDTSTPTSISTPTYIYIQIHIYKYIHIHIHCKVSLGLV